MNVETKLKFAIEGKRSIALKTVHVTKCLYLRSAINLLITSDVTRRRGRRTERSAVSRGTRGKNRDEMAPLIQDRETSTKKGVALIFRDDTALAWKDPSPRGVQNLPDSCLISRSSRWSTFRSISLERRFKSRKNWTSALFPTYFVNSTIDVSHTTIRKLRKEFPCFERR